jgi:hypothetical protein
MDLAKIELAGCAMHADGGGAGALFPVGDGPGHGADAAQGPPMAPRLRHAILLPPLPHHTTTIISLCCSLHSPPPPLPRGALVAPPLRSLRHRRLCDPLLCGSAPPPPAGLFLQQRCHQPPAAAHPSSRLPNGR